MELIIERAYNKFNCHKLLVTIFKERTIVVFVHKEAEQSNEHPHFNLSIMLRSFVAIRKLPV